MSFYDFLSIEKGGISINDSCIVAAYEFTRFYLGDSRYYMKSKVGCDKQTSCAVLNAAVEPIISTATAGANLLKEATRFG